MIRPVAVVGAAVLALAALTACTPNDVNPALSWLDGQDGVAAASVVVDRTDLFGTSGVIRGELDPDLAEDRLDRLVENVAAYVRDHESIELRLGVADVDFVVDDDVSVARANWAVLRDLDDVVAALAVGNAGVRVHVLRPALAATVDALADLDAAVEVEGFADAEAERLDRGDDDYGPPSRQAGSFQIVRGAACDPPADSWARVLATAGDERIADGAVDACGLYDLGYLEAVDLSLVAQEWASAQQTAPDPVPALVVHEDGAGYHEISVTPGDASMIPVVAAFERPDAPVTRYVLPGDGTLDLGAYDDTSASELLALLGESPLASQLGSVSLEGAMAGAVGGETVTVVGAFADLGPLVAEAEAVFPLHESIYQVSLDAASARVDVYAPPGADPDMPAIAAALRASPVWPGRVGYVGYLNGFVIIEDGVARIGDDYTDRELYDAFVEAWNSTP